MKKTAKLGKLSEDIRAEKLENAQKQILENKHGFISEYLNCFSLSLLMLKILMLLILI